QSWGPVSPKQGPDVFERVGTSPDQETDTPRPGDRHPWSRGPISPERVGEPLTKGTDIARADFPIAGADLRPARADFESDGASFRTLGAAVGNARADLGTRRAGFRTEGALLGVRRRRERPGLRGEAARPSVGTRPRRSPYRARGSPRSDGRARGRPLPPRGSTPPAPSPRRERASDRSAARRRARGDAYASVGPDSGPCRA